MRLAFVALLALAPAARAELPSAAPDPVLEGLVREALERSPERARAEAEVEAQRARVPQAGALPDPTLTLGIQNDGFGGLQIGKMETSFYQIMLTQPLPWPGKRGLREQVASSDARRTEAGLARVRLSIAAAVERAYLDLLLARGQLALQAKLEALWKEAEAMARTRYEVGAGPQSDLLRAQLERTRLAQQRVALEAAERVRLEALNRLRRHPLDEPLDTPRRLAEATPPVAPTAEAAQADAEARSPELAQARLGIATAERRMELAHRDRYPDLAVSAGVMPRGSLDPMWTASVSIGLPVFSRRGQAVEESAHRQAMESSGEQAVAQELALRSRERVTQLDALLRTLQLYRSGLLVQSEAAVRSTLGQYQVGKVTFASVLEVLGGYVADEGGYLETLAQAERVAIAQREVALEPAGGPAGALTAGRVPGAGAASGGGARGAAAAAGGGEATGGSGGGAAPSMGGGM